MFAPENRPSPVAAVLRTVVKATVAVIRSPFRTSIWKRTDNYRFAECSPRELENASFVFDVVAAKHRIPFPSVGDCNELLKQIAALPDDPQAMSSTQLVKALEAFLRTTKRMLGVGVPTAMCLLAVVKRGAYAPMDTKFAMGLLCGEAITKDQAESLTSKRLASYSAKSIQAFVNAYVYSVMPAWQEALHVRSPEQADAYWASKA
ncbi:MAG: hypothetical protein WCA85_15495 [Paraburkholderia sp.]|uniref:hypothetical protein n=1 Tax=Paraburkholderia sp. TaxID=1926495 RepID=UPI003C41F30D